MGLLIVKRLIDERHGGKAAGYDLPRG